MREKNINIYRELLEKYKNSNNTEKNISIQLNDKPMCVHINELVNQYENLHCHDYYELLYIEKGSINYVINYKNYTLKSGDMILIPPFIMHNLISFNENEISRYILLFSERFLKKNSTKNTNLFLAFENAVQNDNYVMSFKEAQKFEIEKNINSTSKIMLEESFGIDILYLNHFLKTLIIITNESIRNTEENNFISHNNEIINKIDKYISNNIEQKIVIEDIAKHLALSISRISHIFKKETGISLLKYINKKRITIARKLIEKGESFINIASQCGFQDYTSFFRTFKKELGITPGEYAKKIRLFID